MENTLPPAYDLLVELVATLDSLIKYSKSKDVVNSAMVRRDELMKIGDVSPKEERLQIVDFNKIKYNI